MNFSKALEQVKEGERLTRLAWDSVTNEKVPFIFLVRGSEFEVNRPPLNEFYKEGTKITYRAHIDRHQEDGTIATWVPTQLDLLAEDWVIFFG